MNRDAAHAAIVLILQTPRKRYSFNQIANEILDAIWFDNQVGSASFPLREEDLAFSYFHVKSDPVHQGPRGVSIEHLPTGTVAEAWNEKSQLENKSRALQALRLALENSDDTQAT